MIFRATILHVSFRALLISGLFIAYTPAVIAQKVSFGDVSEAELKMTTYPKDSTAGAVILSDIGKFSSSTYEFTRHIRVKILKKSGLQWGNWIFSTPSKSDFKVFVFNLQNGEVVKDKAEGGSIYKEEWSKEYEVYKVFAPGVRVGSVIDIFYRHIGIPLEWRFQEIIPIAYSDLTIESTSFVRFTKTYYGFEPLQTVSSTQWRAVNMPAFKTEAFLNDYTNYITKFSFQLESFTYYGRTIEISTSWKKVVNNLLTYADFGGALKGGLFLNGIADSIKAKNLPAKQAVAEAFSYVQKEVKWNGVKTLYVSSNFRKNFKETKSCNSAEINIALIILLNKIGIKTVPLVLSTRDNGMLVEYSPAISKLNYVIAMVEHENMNLFLDATSEFNIPGILPEHCLNGRALLVKKDNEQWYSLNNTHKNARSSFTEINVTKEGTAKATVVRDFSSYGFLNWVEACKKDNFDPEILKNNVQNENSGVRIEDYKIVKRDAKTLSGKESMLIDISDQFIDAGDQYLLNPFVLFEFSSNPFKPEERKYPVDLAYPSEHRHTIRVSLPAGFDVTEMPVSTKLTIPDGSAQFSLFSNSTQGKLELMAILKINKHIYTQTEYLELRRFFSEVIKAVEKPVVLTKKS